MIGYNYMSLLDLCLKHKAYNSMGVILEHYRDKKAGGIDFVKLVNKALAEQTPDTHILKLFNCLVEDNVSLSV